MILMNDFKAEPAELRSAMLDAIATVIDSGWYILGNELRTFEKAWADICGVSYGIGVANGMDAIEIGLRCLGIGEGDEVITTPMTAFATVLAIQRTGATPVLADITPDTALLSHESVLRCLSKRTKAVVLVHLYGQIRDIGIWKNFCDRHGILLIEDCAQAHLASIGGKVAGSFGAIGAYSFYPTKNLGALGDAGMLITNHLDQAQRAQIIRNYGQSERYHHPELGLNSRMDEIQAAILLTRLKWLSAFTRQRQVIAAKYQSHIKNNAIQLLKPPTEQDAHVYHLFVINCSRRNELQNHLKNNKIQSLIHYPIPIHKQRPYFNVRRDPEGLGNSENHADTCLSIPCHPQMSDSDVEHVIENINAFMAK